VGSIVDWTLSAPVSLELLQAMSKVLTGAATVTCVLVALGERLVIPKPRRHCSWWSRHWHPYLYLQWWQSDCVPEGPLGQRLVRGGIPSFFINFRETFVLNSLTLFAIVQQERVAGPSFQQYDRIHWDTVEVHAHRG
jgi:hypothetical protein